MKTNTAIRFLLLPFLLVLAAVLVSFIIIPKQTSAAELSAQTAQVLPPGGSTCAPLAVSGFTPYVYGGALHSFEFYVQDAWYVALIGSAGGTSIPFNTMTRRAGPSGSVQIHVDVATTPVAGTLPIAVTLLSAKGSGQPVCISVVTATVQSSGSVAVIVPISPSPVATPAPAPTPAKPAPTTVGPAKATPTPVTTGGVMATSPLLARIQNSLHDACVADGGAVRIWFFLLAVYALIVCAALFWRPTQIPPAYGKEWVAGAITIPFILLFGFWYLVESCRVSPWVPAFAVLIALAGLATAFWNDRGNLTVISLPAARK